MSLTYSRRVPRVYAQLQPRSSRATNMVKPTTNAPDKPGARKLTFCVGCGYCCRTANCSFKMAAHPDTKKGEVCPSLIQANGRYWCKESLKSEQVFESLSTGKGCSWLENPDRIKILTRLIETVGLTVELNHLISK